MERFSDPYREVCVNALTRNCAPLRKPVGLVARILPLCFALCALLLLDQAARAQTVCEATEHGMRADGSDNVAALSKLLGECAGRTIHIAHGTYVFRPQGYAAGLVVPAGTVIVGDGSQGPQQTILQIAETGNFQAFFWIRNVSNVAIRNIRIDGSTYDSGCARHLDYGHAIYIHSDKDQSAGVNGVELSGDFFHNFNGQSWVTINAVDQSPGIGLDAPITIKDNVYDSSAGLTGNCPSAGIGYPTAMLWLHGSDQSAQGLIKNVIIDSNTFNAAYVKGAIAIWSGTDTIDVERNRIGEAGLMLPPAPGTELGRYAIMVYNSAHIGAQVLAGLHPDNIRIVGNVITDPVSCGIYGAAARGLTIVGNRISGQRDRFDGTLPKGAISLNHVENVVELDDNELTNNYIGISAVGSHINMGSNRITPAPGGKAQKILLPQ